MRVRIVKERSKFDNDPITFIKANQNKLNQLKIRIEEAQTLIKYNDVEIERDLSLKISKVCSLLNVDGLRGDIVTNRAAKAFAAYNGCMKVTIKDIKKMIVLCLRHRLRFDPLQPLSGKQILAVFNRVFYENF